MGGEPLVDGAETILHNHRFIDAARELFGSPKIRPTFIVVNLNAPMPAGPIHVDVPTFRGATREQYPLGGLPQICSCLSDRSFSPSITCGRIDVAGEPTLVIDVVLHSANHRFLL